MMKPSDPLRASEQHPVSDPTQEKKSPRKSFRSWAGEITRSGHVHVALALGFSIIVFALVNKRVLWKPIPGIYVAIPGFVALFYETLEGLERKKDKPRRSLPSGYWALTILVATLLIILLHIV